MLVGAIILISLLIIGFSYLIFQPIVKEALEKKTFLKEFYSSVYQLAIDKDFYVINDVVLEIDTKFIHFNHILFGDKYIYCICDSYMEGPISGKFSDTSKSVVSGVIGGMLVIIVGNSEGNPLVLGVLSEGMVGMFE